MIIELTEQQHQAIESESSKPVDVVDTATQRHYVLVPRDQFELVRSLLDSCPCPNVADPDAAITPTMLRSQQAFWRELPNLLKVRSREQRFVAYQEDKRIGFARTQTELYQQCFRLGLKRGEFYIGLLEERDEPPWGPVPLEQSLYEFSVTAEPSATPPTA